MMPMRLILLLLLLVSSASYAQQSSRLPDDLKYRLVNSDNDSWQSGINALEDHPDSVKFRASWINNNDTFLAVVVAGKKDSRPLKFRFARGITPQVAIGQSVLNNYPSYSSGQIAGLTYGYHKSRIGYDYHVLRGPDRPHYYASVEIRTTPTMQFNTNYDFEFNDDLIYVPNIYLSDSDGNYKKLDFSDLTSFISSYHGRNFHHYLIELNKYTELVTYLECLREWSVDPSVFNNLSMFNSGDDVVDVVFKNYKTIIRDPSVNHGVSVVNPRFRFVDADSSDRRVRGIGDLSYRQLLRNVIASADISGPGNVASLAYNLVDGDNFIRLDDLFVGKYTPSCGHSHSSSNAFDIVFTKAGFDLLVFSSFDSSHSAFSLFDRLVVRYSFAALTDDGDSVDLGLDNPLSFDLVDSDKPTFFVVPLFLPSLVSSLYSGVRVVSASKEVLATGAALGTLAMHFSNRAAHGSGDDLRFELDPFSDFSDEYVQGDVTDMQSLTDQSYQQGDVTDMQSLTDQSYQQGDVTDMQSLTDQSYQQSDVTDMQSLTDQSYQQGDVTDMQSLTDQSYQQSDVTDMRSLTDQSYTRSKGVVGPSGTSWSLPSAYDINFLYGTPSADTAYGYAFSIWGLLEKFARAGSSSLDTISEGTVRLGKGLESVQSDISALRIQDNFNLVFADIGKSQAVLEAGQADMYAKLGKYVGDSTEAIRTDVQKSQAVIEAGQADMYAKLGKYVGDSTEAIRTDVQKSQAVIEAGQADMYAKLGKYVGDSTEAIRTDVQESQAVIEAGQADMYAKLGKYVGDSTEAIRTDVQESQAVIEAGQADMYAKLGKYVGDSTEAIRTDVQESQAVIEAGQADMYAKLGKYVGDSTEAIRDDMQSGFRSVQADLETAVNQVRQDTRTGQYELSQVVLADLSALRDEIKSQSAVVDVAPVVTAVQAVESQAVVITNEMLKSGQWVQDIRNDMIEPPDPNFDALILPEDLEFDPESIPKSVYGLDNAIADLYSEFKNSITLPEGSCGELDFSNVDFLGTNLGKFSIDYMCDSIDFIGLFAFAVYWILAIRIVLGLS